MSRWSIGYGTPSTEGGEITEKEALAALQTHITPIIDYIFKTASKASIYEVAALASFAYNVGFSAFKESSVWKFFLEKDLVQSGLYLLKWNKSEGEFNKGLYVRRQIEREVLMGTLHLINEKQIQKWIEERKANLQKGLGLRERIDKIKHNEQRVQKLIRELNESSENGEISKED